MSVVPSPPSTTVSSEIAANACLGEKLGVDRDDSEIQPWYFTGLLDPHPRPARAGGRGPGARPRRRRARILAPYHGLLISSAFQAARGNAPFKVLWLQLQGGGLQEIARGAKQAEGSVTRL